MAAMGRPSASSVSTVTPGSAAATPSVGRDRELAVLRRVLDEHGPRVCFVYGIAGMGKSWLLARFGEDAASAGVAVRTVDCRDVEPTEQGFLDALGTARLGQGDPGQSASSAVLLIDTYEQFRLSDPWLRHELLPRLGPSVRLVVAGREPPMLEWAVERGAIGGVEVLPLGPLDDASVATIIAGAGLADGVVADTVAGISRGHPLSLRLALEARLAGSAMSEAEAVPHVVEVLAGAFRDGLDTETRTALDAAAVPRRITLGVLDAMLGEAGEAAFDRLSLLPFVEATNEGLMLHDAVQAAVVERLRAVDPDRFRAYRTAAWHHLQSASRGLGRRELARSTADLLFLIDNPVVREAMFPTTAHLHSVEPHRPDDVPKLRDIFRRHDGPAGAQVLDRWLARVPEVVRSVRDRTGQLVGVSILAQWRDIPASFEDSDPVVAGWAHYMAHHPMVDGQTTLVLRRVLAGEAGEGPSAAQAAAWLDVKREYLRLRPQLGRVFTVLADPTPFVEAFGALCIRPCEQPVALGDRTFHLSVLEMGPASVDGWLAELAAEELGITEARYLDPTDRSVAVGNERVSLTPLEYGVLSLLSERRGCATSRAELLGHVWGDRTDGGSNTVDVVVRGLRLKLGDDAVRLQTVRGVGYRFR